MKKIYNKLVRDNIPNIIEINGEKPIICILNDDEYKNELEKKLYKNTKKFKMQMAKIELKNWQICSKL